MPFIKTPNQLFKLIDNQIVLNKEYLEKNKNTFKKITGSRLASVLNMNKYCSPIKTWAMMVKIYTEPMDETMALVGNVIEPKIRDYVCKKLNQDFISYDPKKVNWDLFQENKIFGGIPDGEPIKKDGTLAYDVGAPMLEIKTTSIDSFVYQNINNKLTLLKDGKNMPLIKIKNGKYETWFDSKKNVIIPNEYKFQLGLYCYLRKIENGIFAVAFLKQEDYVKPQDTNIEEREIQIVDFNINLKNFEPWIKKATKWFQDFVEKGISPILSEQDLKWYEQELSIYESKNNLH